MRRFGAGQCQTTVLIAELARQAQLCHRLRQHLGSLEVTLPLRLREEFAHRLAESVVPGQLQRLVRSRGQRRASAGVLSRPSEDPAGGGRGVTRTPHATIRGREFRL